MDEIERFDVQRRIDQATRGAERYRALHREALTRIEALEHDLSVLRTADDLRLDPPKWLTSVKRKPRQQTLIAILSDLHLDQVVDVNEMRGANSYDRRIAGIRLRKWADSVCVLRDHFNAVTWDGIVVPVLGDLYPGDIHHELRVTNEAPTLASVEFWADLLAAAISQVADHFGKVHVPWIVGNHGRTSPKPVFAQRATSNVDWLTGRIVARHFRGDRRVTFDVPESMHTQFTAYATTFQCTHGDNFRGGDGIAGIWSPVMRGNAKMSQSHAAIGQPFDHLLIGHFHQLTFGPRVTINGSLVGYDPFAFGLSFTPEPAQQAFLVVHPEHGVTMRGPVHCEDRAKEGW